jgi:1-acyl-sn-glycerol-3-phosphate acyltransferase
MVRPSALEASFGPAADAQPAPLLYRLLRGPLRALLDRWFDLDVRGGEHLPGAGPYLLAANHHNYLDGLVLAASVPQPVSFLVMPRVFEATPLHPVLHRHIGSIRLDVTRPDVAALRAALAALEQGRVIGIFPEGPFSVRGRLEAGLPGVAMLALRSGVPVVPAAIRGTYEALIGRRFYVPRPRPLRVTFGAPRRFSPNGHGGRSARAAVTGQVMADIARLLA